MPADLSTSQRSEYRYGEHPRQVSDLWLPRGERREAIVVFVHGGGYDAGTDRRDVIVNVADLVADGWPVLNVDYRGNGDGGGWDATFTDVATAVDQAAEAAERWGLAADRVAIVGHSAGGHLALWAAARHTLAAGDPGAGPRVVPAVAASMAGVLHPTALAFTDDNVRTVFGGTPAEVDDRYAIGDPARRVPLGMQLLVVHGTGDDTVPFSQAQEFTDAARAAGDSVDLQLLDGVSHVDPLDPDGQSWPLVKRFLENSLG
ncbi:MAG: alpha/beta hydrolase family protein [Janthinobacterium lividum]